MIQRELFSDECRFTDRAVKDVTFQGKLGLPIHRWYRLTPSFSPHLANDIADYFGLNTSDLVLDPFSGVGTVPLCMKHKGIPACSIEINPYLFFVGTVKTRTYRDIPEIADCFERSARHTGERLAKLPSESASQSYLKEFEQWIPRIQPARAMVVAGNLMQLVCVRKMLSEFDAHPQHLDLLKMGVLGILVPVSNAKHNHVSLTFAEKPATDAVSPACSTPNTSK